MKKSTMNLSQSIQDFFIRKNSKIRLDKTNEHELPAANAYIFNGDGRGFNASRESDFSSDVILDFYVVYLTIDKLTIGRAKIANLETLSNVIYSWMEEGVAIEDIQMNYNEIVVFQTIEGLSKIKLDSWNRIKNMVFRTFNFYSEDSNFEKRYYEMLERLAKDERFVEFTPFTSHYRLHLKNKYKSSSGCYIMPINSNDFIVAEQIGLATQTPKINKTFKELESALDFYLNVLLGAESKD